jgi:transcriptional regulator with XRE-family HTH domain
VATDDDKPDEGTPTPSQVLAAELPKIRKRQGLSAEQLGNRVRFLGGQLDQASISKIENGVRGVSLDEAMQLAVALGISPLHLFVPREDAAFVRVTPAEHVTAASARRWIRGTTPLKGQDDRVYRTEVPESEWAAANERVINAERDVERTRHRLRVARASANEILSKLGELESRLPVFNPIGRIGNPDAGVASRPESRLMAAYDQIAEAVVEYEDAVAALRALEREAQGGGATVTPATVQATASVPSPTLTGDD